MYDFIMLAFSVETSCDETSVCIMHSDKTILSHIVYSQEIHKKHGGVVPELASRAHLEILQQITKDCFKQAQLSPNNIDLYSATCGPGLIGGLLVGSVFAKSLSLGANKPFIPINHLEGHLLSPIFNNSINFPHISYLLTGGHTQIYLVNGIGKYKLLGQTLDDAIGEAFDKVAKLLGLTYPGGAEIEEKAKKGNENTFDLPKPLSKNKNFDFSFSGLKTYINLIAKKNDNSQEFVENMCASFQKNISEILITKTSYLLDYLFENKINIDSISLVGGVAKNKYIQNKLSSYCKKYNITVLLPISEMISDNAAMIAWACLKKYNKNMIDINFKADPRLAIDNIYN